MRPLYSLITACGLTVGTLAPSPAAAYPIDCAILLCLAGGFPSSAECAAAYAVFIRRITPIPIEPPLQIWRCPMSASFTTRTTKTEARFFDIAMHLSQRPQSNATILQAAGPTADIDISDPAFDFVRSIEVWQIDLRQKDGTSECKQTSTVLQGLYGVQGDFEWVSSGPLAIPDAYIGNEGWGDSACRTIDVRSVFVSWRDYEGNYDYEQVDY